MKYFWIILCGIILVSCGKENRLMHDIKMEVTFENDSVYVANYYALLNEGKIVEFDVTEDKRLQVKIYSDSTKEVSFTKFLNNKNNVKSFEIIQYEKTPSNMTKIKID